MKSLDPLMESGNRRGPPLPDNPPQPSMPTRRMTVLLGCLLITGWLVTMLVASFTRHIWLPLPWGLLLSLLMTWHRGLKQGLPVAILVVAACIPWSSFRANFGSNSLEALSSLLACGLGVVWLDLCRRRWLSERVHARRDFLTLVGNRQAMIEAVSAELSRQSRHQRPFTLAFLDCDGFKPLNDTYGHARGDEALIRLATALRKNLRGYDTVARMGGDEFVFLLPETDLPVAEHVIERLQANLRHVVERDFPSLTVSMGVVVFRRSPESVDQCLKLADAAMYRARGQGPGRAEFEVYDPEPLNSPQTHSIV